MSVCRCCWSSPGGSVGGTTSSLGGASATGGSHTGGGGGGTTIHVHVAGLMSSDTLPQIMAQMSNLAKGGQAYLTASNALTNAEKLT